MKRTFTVVCPPLTSLRHVGLFCAAIIALLRLPRAELHAVELRLTSPLESSFSERS